ncbi:hypothetical protein RF11_05044 [Thelohanellus kitauei]|uniref:BPTI/Kunitz inhibitor domain-containing protein n=1 Tax=Thelohanellus kitauei TaxID=669202 RepID=A0A0C2JAU2_THEKT|nr:hypothetical protein RF11_05044 [Thelohanellus kitauei]
MRFLLSILVIYLFFVNATTLEPHFRCKKLETHGDCGWFWLKPYFYYDYREKTCLTFSSCGPLGNELTENIFKNEVDCNLICASVHRTKSHDCLVDWGESHMLSIDATDHKFAYNPQKATCKPYEKHDGYPTPLLFDTYLECRNACFARDEE